jgi:hypothetical protein
MKLVRMLLCLFIPGCTVTRSIAPAAAPETIESYLRTHPHAALRVTDSTGRARWVYDASLGADTLRGFRASTMPRQSLTIPVREIRQVAAPRFSPVHTMGFIAAIGALVAGLAIMAPDPVY